MTKYAWALLPTVAVVGAMGVLRQDGDRRLQVVGGRATVAFFPGILEANNLKTKIQPTADGDTSSGEASSGFRIASATLNFTLDNGRLTRFGEGSVSVEGGFTIGSGKYTINATGFTVAPSKVDNEGLQVFVETAKRESYVAFELLHPRIVYQVKEQQLVMAQMDLTLSLRGAQELGRPDLAGKVLGIMSVFGNAKPVDGGGDINVVTPKGGGGDAAIDVALSSMGSLTVLARTGTYPNGRNGLSMSTTSCNVGTSNIPWQAPMNVAHPVIAMNVYRLFNGRFEQVGWSWLKHGFFATNSAGCGTCQSPGTGSLLGPGCSDTYGTGNNGDRNYLGGRDEVNPFTGVWTCQGSYFSNFINDCTRRNTGSELPNGVEHRLEIRDGDLPSAGTGNVGATYYYEAYYINTQEVNKYNQIGSRTASFTWNGSSWSASTTDSVQVTGPAINRWGEMRSTAQPQTFGDVIVAVQTTNLGNGMWHYEYAVYNHDLDRQVRQFSIPVPVGATVQNIGFKDIDWNPATDWAGVYQNGAITWATGTEGSSSANPLKYSSVFNFRFDCNVAPTNGDGAMSMFKAAGGDPSMTFATKVPVALSPVSSYAPTNGTVFGGNLQSLRLSDNDRLEVGPVDSGSRTGTGLITTWTAPSGASNLTIGIESNNTLAPSTGVVQTVELYNWNTDSYEQIDSRATTQSDSAILLNVSSASRFINPSNREVRARILHVSQLGETGNRWKMNFDVIGFQGS